MPLIKSPSLRVPPPVSAIIAAYPKFSLNSLFLKVEMPPDIHPLPEDVTAYVRVTQPLWFMSANKLIVRLSLHPRASYLNHGKCTPKHTYRTCSTA